MQPYINLLGREVPAYWLCGLIGAIAVAIAGALRGRRLGIKGGELVNTAALAAVGALIGSKLLYLITLAPYLIKDPSLLHEPLSLLSGGVFYGGLGGGVAAVWLYCRRYGEPAALYLDFAAPLISLFHAFGRLGCFMSGCCWGVESETLGVCFHESLAAPNGVPLFPVQLVEAGALLLLSALLFIRGRRKNEGLFKHYLAAYAVLRFTLEFFRGDLIRGVLLLSTSQWIALATLAALIYLRYRPRTTKASE